MMQRQVTSVEWTKSLEVPQKKKAILVKDLSLKRKKKLKTLRNNEKNLRKKEIEDSRNLKKKSMTWNNLLRKLSKNQQLKEEILSQVLLNICLWKSKTFQSKKWVCMETMSVSKKKRLKEKTFDKVELSGKPNFTKLILSWRNKGHRDLLKKLKRETKVAIITKFMEIYLIQLTKEPLQTN